MHFVNRSGDSSFKKFLLVEDNAIREWQQKKLQILEGIEAEFLPPYAPELQLAERLKSGGYNLERTQTSDERLNNLILLLALAYSCAVLQGQQIKRKSLQKYVDRLT